MTDIYIISHNSVSRETNLPFLCQIFVLKDNAKISNGAIYYLFHSVYNECGFWILVFVHAVLFFLNYIIYIFLFQQLYELHCCVRYYKDMVSRELRQNSKQNQRKRWLLGYPSRGSHWCLKNWLSLQHQTSTERLQSGWKEGTRSASLFWKRGLVLPSYFCLCCSWQLMPYHTHFTLASTPIASFFPIPSSAKVKNMGWPIQKGGVLA